MYSSIRFRVQGALAFRGDEGCIGAGTSARAK